jgi:hypothetical protein
VPRDRKDTFEDLYSVGGLPGGPDYHSAGALEAHKPKGGPLHERVVTERWQGPASVQLYRMAMGGLAELHIIQTEIPPDEAPGVFHRQIDPQGRRWLVIQFPIPGTQSHEQYRISLSKYNDPDFEIPDGGGIVVGGRPVERPINIGAGSLDVPSGEESRRTTVSLVGIRKTVLTFSDSVNQFGDLVMSTPEGYSGGPVAVRFYFYSAGAGSGNVEMGVQVRAVSDGESVPAMVGTFTAAPVKAVTAAGTLYQTGWTDYFDPQSAPGRGDEFHMQFRRNTATASNLAQTVWLSNVQMVYPKDRATDRALS